MNAEFFEAIEDIEKEKGIPRTYMYEKIRQAMLAAFRRDNPECEDNVEIVLDEDKKQIEMHVRKLVVEEVEDPSHEIQIEAAKKFSKRAKNGDVIAIPVETKKFGRIAAQAANQVIIQGIREAERGIIYEEFTSKEHEILTGIVSRIDPRTGGASIRIASSSEYTEASLAPNERIKNEVLKEGDRLKVSLSHTEGFVDVTVGMEGQEPIYRGNGQQNAEFVLEIAETGNYHISVSGHQAKGNVSFTRISGEKE